MLTVTRIINLLIIAAVMLLLAYGGYRAYSGYQLEIEAATSARHTEIVRGFSNTVWKMHQHKVLPLIAQNAPQIADEIDGAVFVSDVMAYLKDMEVTHAYLYTSSKQTIMSYAVAGAENGVSPSRAIADQVLVSKVATRDMVRTNAGGWVVVSYVPLKSPQPETLVFVLMTDVSASISSIQKLLAMIVGLLALAVFMVFVLNYLNTRFAENIVTKQFEENADLLAQAATAKEENQQKSQFLANISHELRTPLNAIIGFSEILKNEFVPAAGQTKHVNYISDIHSAGSHLLSLINDILDYSKAEAGKLELDATEINAVKMVQNCMRLVQPRAEIGQIKLVEALPKEQMVMITDGKKFKQILLNLLSNAVKFTPTGGSVKVSAWVDMKEDACVFEVKDSGIGIAPKDISRAMSPFGQVENALSRKYEGTGLGLPLTKKFVEIMGGTFSIESELNKGTTVTFSLPRVLTEREGVIVKQMS